jgi:hypothetical protein
MRWYQAPFVLCATETEIDEWSGHGWSGSGWEWERERGKVDVGFEGEPWWGLGDEEGKSTDAIGVETRGGRRVGCGYLVLGFLGRCFRSRSQKRNTIRAMKSLRYLQDHMIEFTMRVVWLYGMRE